ncbi:MAG TPA: DUF2330 domain-containing protein [Polyangiaceae bacterium]|nr:DUF2330 domain-containing protein [Polyangiaceae bacterium]
MSVGVQVARRHLPSLRSAALSAAVVAAASLAAERPANACGGCFAPTQTVTDVTDHRMVFSVSATRTILWDQFRYSGNPSEFAWVLPVHAAGVKVELAHDEFISALDAWTAPVIVGPQQGGGGFGCSSSASSYGGDNGGVQVINQEIVGPYEVATLRSTDPTALETWLSQHGYSIPPAVQPTIAAYVNEGFDFIALRLLPNQGIQAMQPVRVISDGADPTLPLRMVAAGIGANVGIVLYVISEGRYEASNFNNTQVDLSQLTWNKTSNSSNYDQLIQQAMTSGDGRNFTVEFAGHLFANDPSLSNTSFRQSFKNIYYQGVTSSQKCPYTQVHGADFPSDAGVFFDAGGSDAAANDAALDDGGDASADAAIADSGADAGTGDAGTPPTLAEPYDKCVFDDLTTATEGMNLNDVWVTRLRANLQASALSQDLGVKAAADQTPYDNVHQVTATGDGCATTDASPDRGAVVLGLGVIAAVWAARRRRRQG